jgi:hypothetical protein
MCSAGGSLSMGYSGCIPFTATGSLILAEVDAFSALLLPPLVLATVDVFPALLEAP